MEKGRIGLNAGKVWHALNEVNEISTQELSRKLSLSIEDLALAIGWLARENYSCIYNRLLLNIL